MHLHTPTSYSVDARPFTSLPASPACSRVDCLLDALSVLCTGTKFSFPFDDSPYCSGVTPILVWQTVFVSVAVARVAMLVLVHVHLLWSQLSSMLYSELPPLTPSRSLLPDTAWLFFRVPFLPNISLNCVVFPLSPCCRPNVSPPPPSTGQKVQTVVVA